MKDLAVKSGLFLLKSISLHTAIEKSTAFFMRIREVRRQAVVCGAFF